MKHKLIQVVFLLFVGLWALSAYAAPVPTLTFNAPSNNADPLLNQSFDVRMILDNTDATDSGFFPAFHFIAPKEFTYNGSNACQNLGVSSIDVQNNPSAVDTLDVENPFTGEIFTLQAGETFVAIKPNLGSHAPDQPEIRCTVGFDFTLDGMSQPIAVAGTPYTFRQAQAMYVLGGLVNGAPGDCGASDTLCSLAQTDDVTAQALKINKTVTSTNGSLSANIALGAGPTYPETVNIAGSISNVVTLNNVTIEETIPEILEVSDPGDCSSFSITPAPTSCVYTPDISSATGGTIGISYASINANFNISYMGVYKQFRDDASEIVDPNTLSATAETTGVVANADELSSPVLDTATYRAYGLDIEKSWSLATDMGGSGLTPLDSLEFTVDVALSDYYEVNNLVIGDALPDGLSYATSSMMVVVNEGGVITNINEADLLAFGHLTQNTYPDGSSDFSLDIGSLMADTVNFSFADTTLSGDGVFSSGSSTGIQIIYQAIVDEDFETLPPTTDVSIDAGDVFPLPNATLTNYDVVGGNMGESANDDTYPDNTEQDNPSIVSLQDTQVEISHVNGSPVGMGAVHVEAGDEVTYKITVLIPGGDVEDLNLTNYLANPLFDESPCLTYDGAAIPANNMWSFGTNDPALASGDITLTCSNPNNSINFAFVDFEIAGGGSGTVELFFTKTVTNEPFLDGLLQNNMVVTQYNNSANTALVGATGTYLFIGDAPFLNIDKGVESTDDPNASITDGNISDVDANAVLSYLVTLENSGQQEALDVVFTDVINTGFVAPSTSAACMDVACGYNISLSPECSNSSVPDITSNVDETTIEIIDMSIASGDTCEIRFDLRLVPDAIWGNTYTNSAQAVFASVLGGTTFSPVDDESEAQIEAPSLGTVGVSPVSGTVGDFVTFDVVVNFPQGQAASTRAILREISGNFWGSNTPGDYTIAVSGGVSGTGPYCVLGGTELCFGNDPENSLDASSNTQAFIDLGTASNTATDLSGRTATFSFQAQTRNVSANNKNLEGQFRFNDGSDDITVDSDNETFTLNKPDITVIKCADASTEALEPFNLSDTLGYNIVVKNSGSFLSTAFDLSDISDVLPQGLQYAANTVNAYYCSSGASSVNAGNCSAWEQSDCTAMLTDISASVRSGESAESSPFGGDSRQNLTFPFVDPAAGDDLGEEAYVVYQIQTEVSCESASDSDGVNSPIGSHPDDDGVVNGCTDPVMPYVSSISNTASLASYSSLDGVVAGEATFGATDDTSPALDVDHDGDGIANGNEGSGDADGDGVPNYLDTDSDDNGTDDATEGTGDADGDGTPDYQDTDDDNDGVTDADEITTSMGTMIDSDGDGTPDYLDNDSDGDGILDGDEGGPGTDSDSDGTPDYLDLDSDNDGIPDLLEHMFHVYDSDGNGLLSTAEIAASGLDSNMDGAISVTELPGGAFDDVDGDGMANYLDLDADGDGIPDLDESGLTVYDDNADNLITTAEGNDIDDGAGDDVSGGANDDNSVLNFDEIPDSDGDGLLNFLDRDSDNDGVYDFVENGRYVCDSDDNGFITSTEVTACGALTDGDGDGLLQLDEAAAPNSDAAAPGAHTSDTDPDYIDIDSDGDGIADWIEAYNSDIDTDVNGSISDAEYSAANGGGDLLFSELADSEDTPDGTPDIFDLDSDGDTIYDMHESDASEMYPSYDTSSVVILYSNLFDSEAVPDGIPDFRDLDSDGDSFLDADEAGDADLNTIPVAIDDPAQPDFQNFNRPELVLSKCAIAGTQDPVTLAGNVNYAVHIENIGDRTAYDVDNLVDVLPQGLQYSATSASVFYCSQGADTDSCGHDVSSDPDCVNISAAITASEIIESSPFGADSRQNLEFVVRNTMGMNEIAPDAYYAISIPTAVSCESAADNSGLDFPIGVHPDNDGIVNGCSDPVMPGVASISNLIAGLDYSTYAGLDPNETVYSSADSNSVALDTDHDGDGQLTGDEGTADADSDGVPNYLDTDSDDNGVSDSLDSTGDADSDGTPDYIDADDDNDGLSDSEELTIGGSGTDTDGDGMDDSMDPDSDGDGFIDGEDGGNGVDTDGDGQEDSLDNDSDNDGILDMIEIGLGVCDTNMDGQLSDMEIRDDMNCFDTNDDGAISESELPGGVLPDADGDGTPDYQDTDSDNDGISDLEDNFFGQLTPAQLATVDANDNGQIESPEQAALYALLGDGDGVLEDSDLSDTDNDGTPNHLDIDSDGDGIPDLIEGARFVCDANEDANLTTTEVMACVAASDTNMDGLLQNNELPLGDQDNDTFFNYVDIDADGDGIGDIIEGHVSDIDGNANGSISLAEYQAAYPSGMIISDLADSETVPDATPDYFDLDSDNDNILDLHESDATETYPMYNAGTLVTLYANLFDSETVPDGIPDFRDTDSDNDTILDSNEAGDAMSNTIPVDTDMDGIPNFQDTDADDDGLLDMDEATLMSDPTLADTDMDGCTDSCEVFGTNPPAEASCPFIGHPSAPGTVMSPISDPTDADTDDGGTNDCDEANEPSDPRNPNDDPFLDEDADNDGVTNGDEATAGTDPNDPDSDGDGCTDGCEIFGTTAMCPYDDPENSAWFPGMGTIMSPVTNPLVTDSDGDGCNDCLEATTLFTNPNVADTDSDGANDCQEYNAGSDPNNPDTDGDGLLDGAELNTFNTDPTSNDTDMDGCLDGVEVNTYGSNPLADPDSDNDGLTDCEEDGTYGTDRNDADTDNGGINDGDEVNIFNSNPLDPTDDCPTVRDTDGDGLTDCEEIDLGLDPSDPNDATPRGSGTVGFLDWGLCNSGASNPSIVLLMLLAVLMALLRKVDRAKMRKNLFLLIGLCIFLVSQPAQAINIHYVTPKILNPDGHQALSSTTLEPGKYAVGAYFTWTKNPLEFGPSGDGERLDDIVKWIFTQDVLMGFGVSDRFSFQVHAPFHVYNNVENFSQFTSTKEFNVGDITLQGLLQLQGKNWNAVGGTWGFGFVPFVTFPVGEENRFFGNQDITGGGYFVLDRWGGMKRHYITMNLGGRYRPNIENIGALEIGSEVMGKLGYVYRFLNSDGWQVFAELSGSMSLHEPKEVNSPGEMYLGLQKISKNQRWKWTMGTSRGGNNGYGAPEVRLYTGISYTNKSIPKKPTPPKPKPKPIPTPTPKPTPKPIQRQTGMLNLKIVDKYGEKINTQIKVMSDSQSQPLFEGEISELNKTVNEGVVMVMVGDGEKPLRKIFQIKPNQDNNYSIVYDQGKGEKLDLNGKIYFASGQYQLNVQAKAILLDAYEKIQKAKVNKLYVEAHTDSLGDAEKNLELSTERANAVRQYLIELGMDPRAVSAKGKGETDPIASNTTADGRALNRRVEFFVQ
ncbi:OmpA family protein [bacterium]|nr:OmpA family protein [bacterium]